MAVPTDPDVTSIVTQALKRAGRTTPSAAQIQEAADHAIQEVKADIMLAAPTHPNLMATATTVTTKGQQRYEIPGDLNEYYSITLLDGPDSWRGTVQGSGASTITLANDLTASADDLIGKYILITGGTGIEQYREILGYDVGTKVATVDTAWSISPTTSSTYLIVNDYCSLWPSPLATDIETIRTQTVLQKPTLVGLFDQEYILYPIPDKSTYGLLARYWVDLSKLDESEPLFIQLLREWRSIWIQGVAVKSMQRFDEDRYQSEMAIYKVMLDALTNQTCIITQVRFRDFV